MRHPFAIAQSRLGLIIVLAACSESPPHKPTTLLPPAVAPVVMDTLSAPAIDTIPPPLDTALGRCGVALQPPSEPQQEVIEALRAAYGLEASLMSQISPFTRITRDEVYAHYRMGFGKQQAEQLTNYSWQPEIKGIRSTDPALAVPDTVGVLELKQDRALVAWIAPTSFRRQWSAPRCFVDRLVREDGRWIIEAREP